METTRYDVVVLGGAFSGSAAATLLRREAPQLSILVVEKAPRFDAKVGEATTEMSAMFLTRRLALWRHLEAEHLPKEGLRYWFVNERVHNHGEASETGGYLRSTIPSFQLRRDVLDEHLLAEAEREGATVWRPARAVEVEIGELDHRVTIERGRERLDVRCRWLLDATGRATFVGKRLGLVDRTDEHPTTSCWGRFRDVRHIDDLAAREYPALAAGNIGSRRLGTNHYVGRGYWVWVIPLGNGETSIGVVYDRRLLDLDPQGAHRGDPRGAFEAFLRAHPLLGELLAGATLREEDYRGHSPLAYLCRQYAGPGWALLGDAAAFLDPYYSPGLDHASFTIEASVELVKAESRGEPIAERLAEHNATFRRSYLRFFEAIYRDKYFYMGEHDLLSAAFLIETAQYYLFVVTPAYRLHKRFFWMPVLGPREAAFNYWLMKTANRRFKKIAEWRRRAGEAGRRNDGRRLTAYFAPDTAPLRMALRGVRLWVAAELDAVRLRLRLLAGGRDATDATDATAPPDAVPERPSVAAGSSSEG